MHNSTQYANSIFEQPWWLDIVAKDCWHEVTVEENGEVVARLPYIFKRKNICMPPLTQTLGPWIKQEYRENQPGNTQFGKQKKIINALLEQLPKHRSFRMCFDNENSYILPYRWEGFSFEPTFSYRINDLTNIESIYNNLHKNVKRNIKRAEKLVQINYESNPDILIELMTQTFSSQNRKLPISKELIRKIVLICDKNESGRMFTAIDEQGRIHACSYMIYDKKRAYSLFSGRNNKVQNSDADTLIYWDEIKYASSVTKIYDFEGSMIEGIEFFVRQFGGKQVINFRVTKQSIAHDIWYIFKPRIKKMIGYKQ